MISLIVTSIITVALALIKGALSLILFLLKWIGRILRLFWSLLPVTGTALLLTGICLVAFSFTGRDPLPPAFPYHPNGMPFLTSLGSLIFLVRDLKAAVPGFLGILILIAAVILSIPVLLALLIAHAGIALLPVIVFLFAAELIVYLIYGILSHRSPFEQIRARYYLLFPKSADRHNERAYHAWLRRHADEFEDDTYGRERMERPYRRSDRFDEYEEFADTDRDPYPEERDRAAVRAERRAERRAGRREEREMRRRRRIEDYYGEEDEDDRYEEDDVYDEEEDGYEDRYDDRYDDRHDAGRRGTGRGRYEDRYEDRYDEEDDEYEDEDEEEPRQDAPRSSFDFFAGCRNLADVEKKYRSLVKIYHPDNQGGDTSAIQEINAQYAEAKRRFR